MLWQLHYCSADKLSRTKQDWLHVEQWDVSIHCYFVLNNSIPHWCKYSGNIVIGRKWNADAYVKSTRIWHFSIWNGQKQPFTKFIHLQTHLWINAQVWCSRCNIILLQLSHFFSFGHGIKVLWTTRQIQLKRKMAKKFWYEKLWSELLINVTFHVSKMLKVQNLTAAAFSHHLETPAYDIAFVFKTSEAFPSHAIEVGWYNFAPPEKTRQIFLFKLVTLIHAAEPVWNSLSLLRWYNRHHWQAEPVQSWMDNSGSCTVLDSCLWKEWHAAGITDRTCSHGGLLFWWDASPLSVKCYHSCFVDLMLTWNTSRWAHTEGDDSFHGY